MKKSIFFILAIFLTIAFNANASGTALSQQPTEQGVSKTDSTISAREEPITKTVVLDDEETGESNMPPRNKWITAGLVVFGIAGFIFLKTRRKKKPVGKDVTKE